MTSQEAAALLFLMSQLDTVAHLGQQIRRDMDAAVEGTNMREILQRLAARAEAHEVRAPIALPVTPNDELGLYIHDAKGHEVVAVHDSKVCKWLVSLINGGNDAALDCLRAFTRTITATGGICVDEEGRALSLVETSDEWIDLADCYVRACQLLGESPVIEPGDPTYSDEDADADERADHGYDGPAAHPHTLPPSLVSCAKCGKPVNDGDAVTDEGAGTEAGRTFYYCSTQCLEMH